MSVGLSADSIKKAYKEADTFRVIQFAKRDFNVHHDDGMTLKIPQDNKFDKFVNTIDNRRIILEKKAEILHDFYGDRLLAKELFKRYLSYKSKVGGVANLLTLGLVGANMYTRVMNKSVLLGKLGTLCAVIAIQAAGRYFTNNYLERQIERPWKIHCNRMSQGLGPTNLPSNDHPEIDHFSKIPRHSFLLFGSAFRNQEQACSQRPQY